MGWGDLCVNRDKFRRHLKIKALLGIIYITNYDRKAFYMSLSFQIKMNIKEKRVQHQTSWDVGRGVLQNLSSGHTVLCVYFQWVWCILRKLYIVTG